MPIISLSQIECDLIDFGHKFRIAISIKRKYLHWMQKEAKEKKIWYN